MKTSYIDNTNVRVTSAKNVQLNRIDYILKDYNGDYAKWQSERYPVSVDRSKHKVKKKGNIYD